MVWFTVYTDGYQIQSMVSQDDSETTVRISTMATTCQRDRHGRHPVIESFVTNYWISGCLLSTHYTKHPMLFNGILNALRSCGPQCTQTYSTHLPEVECGEQTYPNTLSVNYRCGTAWQTPGAVVTTPARMNNTNSTQTEANSTTDLLFPISANTTDTVLLNTSMLAEEGNTTSAANATSSKTTTGSLPATSETSTHLIETSTHEIETSTLDRETSTLGRTDRLLQLLQKLLAQYRRED